MKREKNKFYFISFLICSITIFSIFFTGCVDENLTPNEGNVSVHLYDYMGIPGHMYGARFSIGPYPLKITDLSGNTSFQISSFPYNLRLHYENYTNNIFVFDGLTNKENFVTLPLHYYYTYSTSIATMNVHYPTVPRGNRAILKFISNDAFHEGYQQFLDTSAINSFEYRVLLPFNKNSISGKLIFFLVTVDTYQNSDIIYFDNYGEKQVTLSANSYQYVEFSNDDIKTIPVNVYTNYTVLLPPGYSHSNESYLYMSFDTLHSSSDISIYQSSHTWSYFISPILPSSNYKIKLHNIVLTDYNVNSEQEKWTYGNPGSSINMDNSSQPVLILPQKFVNRISDTTIFSYTSPSNTGIYCVQFHLEDDPSVQTFITAKTKISLRELKDNGINFLPNSVYYWWVEQPSGFSSVDEYLSAPYTTNQNYTSKLCSTVRTFTTAP